MLNIRLARPEEYAAVVAFYNDLIDQLKNAEYAPGWKKGIYPAYSELERAILAEELFLGFDGETLCAAMIINHSYNESYDKVDWPTPAAPEEVSVIHALGVLPSCGHRGLGKEMVRFALERAKAQEQKVMRLDVLAGNVPAERLYPAVGFQYVTTLEMYYEDTGWVAFLLFECVIRNS